MASAWLPQRSWALGEVSPTYAVRYGSEEQAFGAQTVDNFYVDYDGTLNFRFGTEHLFTVREGDTGAGVDGVKARVLPASVGDSDYLIVVTSGASANNDQEIYVYKRGTDNKFATTPISVGNGLQSTQLPPNDLSDSLPHNYSEDELDALDFSVMGDYVFITHNNHPTLMLKYGQIFGTEFWEWNPFFGNDAEIVTFREPNQLTPNRESMGDPLYLDSTTPIFNATHVNGVVVAGDVIPAIATVDDKNVGRFFRIISVDSPTRAQVADITGDSGVATTVIVNSQYAGPWTADELNPTLQNTDVAIPASVPTGGRFTINVPLSTPDVVGAVLHIRSGGTDYYFYGVKQTNAVPSVGTFINVGRATPAGGLPIGVPFQFMRTAQGVGFGQDRTIQNVTIERGDNGGGTSKITFRRIGDIPEDHVNGFQEVAGSVVGGAILVNGGVARVVSRDFDVSGQNEAYNILWEREPITIAPTREWGLGPSEGTGFAATTTTHQSRLVLAGYNNSAVVLSRTNDPTAVNALDYLGLADAPLNLQLVSSSNPSTKERVQWLSSEVDLLVGTNLGEYSLRGSPLTSTSLGLDRHSEYGGELVKPVRVGANSLFVQRGGRVIRSMRFTEASQRYESPNLTRHADHILADGETIRRMITLYNPAPLVFILTSSGRIVLFSRSEEDGVKAFSTLTSAGTFVDIAKVRQETGAGDEILAVVLRNGTHRIERFKPGLYMEAADLEPSFVDIGGGGITVTDVASHLRNANATVIVDGKYYGSLAVSGAGEIDLSTQDINSPTTIHVGLPYTGTVKFNVPDLEDGTTVGTTKQQRSLRIFVEDSLGGDGGDNLGLPGLEVATATTLTPATDWVDVVGLEDSGGRFIGPEITVNTPFKFRISAYTADTDWRQ